MQEVAKLLSQKQAAERRKEDRTSSTVNELFVRLGGGAVDAGTLMQAIRSGEGLAAIIHSDKDLERVLYQFAYQALHLEQKEQAHARFQVLCFLNTTSADYWLGFALSHAMWPRNTPEIKAALECAQTLAPENPTVLLRICENHMWNGALEAASRVLETAQDLLKSGNDATAKNFANRIAYALELKRTSE